MMFIYESNGCRYSSSNEISICSNGSTTGTQLGIRNTNVPNDQIVQCVCDLEAQSQTNITVYYDAPGYNTCGTKLKLEYVLFSCRGGSVHFAFATNRLLFEKTYSYNDEWCMFITTATNLRTTPTSRQTPKRPTTTTTTTTTTTSSSTTQVTTPLTTPPPTTSTLQQHPTPAKTSTIEAKVPDSSLGTTPVLELNITTKKTFSATAIVLISIGFGLFVTVTVPVVIILALKCIRSNKQNVDHAANVQMSNIGNNFNSETNSDLQTFPDTDSLRYESLQKRTADDSYTNLQMSTGNQNNHLQHLYVGDSSTAHRNKNVSATTDNESHYENSSSQPLSVNSSPRYESLKSRTGPLSDHCYSTLQT
ncbi:uncharacterized protein LOC128224285 isoform X2 [Mya arenaria]|uniref:uncharacterized protein LOC128224285 isoform X2 n=1 Tax=Mya arenaria TaxID=6604 RepID=UPI0022E25303|nr:uncharacterized protein LOC128224285 isoform X2 [Mya arenaria]